MFQFAHLHLHTEYSLLESTIRIKELAYRLKELDYSHCAITDSGNMFGAIEFHHELRKLDIVPIIGMSAYVVSDLSKIEGGTHQYQTLFLCQNKEGYKNLTYLASKGYTEGKIDGIPHIDHALIEKHHSGLIVLSGGINGEVGTRLNHNQKDEAYRIASWYKDVFSGRYYIELQSTGLGDEQRINELSMTLAQQLDLPLVGANHCLYLSQEDAEAHYIFQLYGLQKKITDVDAPKQPPNHAYLKSLLEMQEVFQDNHLPQEALTNTMVIAEQCNLELYNSTHYLPKYVPPPNHTLASWFEHASKEGLNQRLDTLYQQYQPSEDFQTFRLQYDERLDFELSVINQMNYAGYFLIVADFINWAKDHDVCVGPGRGSGAGSIIAYALKITDVDPLKYGLLFERFLNPERVSLPDFDIDFDGAGRERVIQYVKDKYGQENVCQISTFQSLGAKAVLRSVCRVLGFPYKKGDEISKLVPNKQPAPSLSEAIQQEVELKRLLNSGEEEEKRLMNLALKLEGLKTHLGTHAAGIIIMDSPVSDVMPVCTGKEGDMQSMFTMSHVEDQGGVKFDFLGLQNLIIIKDTVDLIQSNHHQNLDIDAISLNDTKTFELLSRGETTGIFQLESQGNQKLLTSMKPSSFEDIVATIALYRPGPLKSGMVDTFVECKHGRKKIVYLHPLLEPILSETYGVMVYQEQVMQSAQNLALFSLSQADLLRRAMGKKKPEELAKQRENFVNGCLKNTEFINLCQEEDHQKIANTIFENIDHFSGYGFNKSHTVAYGLIAYQTAYLKAHYPIQFITTWLNCSIGNSDKLLHFIQEAHNMGVQILPPDVNFSFQNFSISTIGYQITEDTLQKLQELFQDNHIILQLQDLKNQEFTELEHFLESLKNCLEEDFEKYKEVLLSLSQKQAVRFGLHGIKELSKHAVESIIETRTKQDNQTFKDFIDFFKFTNLSNFSKKALTTLVQCGGFDSINPNRALLLEVLEQAYFLGSSYQKEMIPDQNSLFDLLSNDELKKAEVSLEYPDIKPWNYKKLLAIEKTNLGFYISGHPLNHCLSEIKSFGVCINSVQDYINKESFYIIGMISHKMIKMDRNMNHFAMITLEDLTGSINISIRGKVYDEYQDNLVEDEPIIIKTKYNQFVSKSDEKESEQTINFFNIEEIYLLDQFREQHVKSIHLSLNFNQDLQGRSLEQLQSLPQIHSGQTPITIHLSDSLNNQVSIQLKEKVNLSPQLIQDLQENLKNFQIDYSYPIN